MHKKHNSHHIFLYLGLLVLLFIFVFGIRHFASEYTFSKEGIEINNSQDYEDGIRSSNPFSERSNEGKQEQEIIPAEDTSLQEALSRENEKI